MSTTVSERLANYRNHLESNKMAAANSFYSIVAGVGAGTGVYCEMKTPLDTILTFGRTFCMYSLGIWPRMGYETMHYFEHDFSRIFSIAKLQDTKESKLELTRALFQVALKFAKTYPVVLLARNPDNYESIVKEIKSSGGHAIGISTDVTSESSVKNAFAEIQKEFQSKKLAAAIFNVGGGFVRKPFLELTLQEYESGYAANGYASSVSAILCGQHVTIIPTNCAELYLLPEKGSSYSPKAHSLYFLTLFLPPLTLPP
jgi:short chain dehydrogenase